jgi:predicted metal-dependent HD superfamily phosphohydrolase
VDSPADALRRCWHGIAGDGFDAIAELIVARHAEPHRRYHTAEHVCWVLHHVDAIVAAERPPDGKAIDVDAVRAAALFHDIVYDPRSSTNEADSAGIAVGALAEIGWTEPRCRNVHSLVCATASHHASTFESAVLLDADLAVLGAPPDDYRDYVTAVRAEYGFVDDTHWISGRSQVLRSFLDRRNIFTTATMAAARERQARDNLTAELDALTSTESH